MKLVKYHYRNKFECISESKDLKSFVDSNLRKNKTILSIPHLNYLHSKIT